MKQKERKRNACNLFSRLVWKMKQLRIMIIVRNKKYYDYSDDDVDDLDNDDNSSWWIKYTIDVILCEFLHLYMSLTRWHFRKKILKMIKQQQSNFAIRPPEIKNNQLKKTKVKKSWSYTLCLDIWPVMSRTVRNDAISYRISLMSNQKGLRQSPTNTDCLHERSRS